MTNPVSQDNYTEKASITEAMYGFVKSKKRLTDKQLEKVIDKAMQEGMSKSGGLE